MIATFTRPLAVLTISTIAALAEPAAAASPGLADWVDETMVPEVRKTLVTHARFRGQTVRFVVFDDRAPAAVSNKLAITLRDRLVEAAVTASRIRVATDAAAPRPGAAIDCTRDDADYLVGIEITPGLGSSASVVVRALDIRENAWVGGFAVDWRGKLDRTEQRALATPHADPALRGARRAPFEAGESDLLARRLARDLACQLLRGPASDYVIDAGREEISEDDPHWQKTLDLARRQLTAHDAVELTTDASRATARLTGTAHELGNGLYQYWLTVVPEAPGGELETLSVSAYVRLGAAAHDTPANDPVPVAAPVVALPGGHDATLLGPLGIVQSGHGSVLKTTARADTIVFFIQYDPGRGMVRLGDRHCRPRTIARLARAGEALAFPVADRRAGTAAAGELAEWRVTPTGNTYFAVAVSDSRLARRLASHVDRLPMRCGHANPRGLDGDALYDWLDELAELTGPRPHQVAWRAVEMRDIL